MPTRRPYSWKKITVARLHTEPTLKGESGPVGDPGPSLHVIPITYIFNLLSSFMFTPHIIIYIIFGGVIISY